MNDVQLGPTAQQVLNVMRSHPGELFSPEELTEHVDCTAMQVRLALETLLSHGLVEKERTAGGIDEYVLRA